LFRVHGWGKDERCRDNERGEKGKQSFHLKYSLWIVCTFIDRQRDAVRPHIPKIHYITIIARFQSGDDTLPVKSKMRTENGKISLHSREKEAPDRALSLYTVSKQ
ncbi:MAG: hypothetical protein II409_01695, partial [Clostridia bacterium]|nr:hypothetical protein [Clostridia bacterium]